MLETNQNSDSTTPLLSASQHPTYTTCQTTGANLNHTVEDGLYTLERQPEKWNEPRINFWRVLATFYSFIVVGANDGAYGVGSTGGTIYSEFC